MVLNSSKTKIFQTFEVLMYAEMALHGFLQARHNVAMHNDNAPEPIGITEAFWFWLKIGFISFGGPAGQIALMHQELVDRKRWISERRYLHALNYCMVLPGPEAQQLATYIGWLMHRTWGGVMAGVLFVLPSLLILIGLSWIYVAFGHVDWIAGLFYGIKPAVTAIVLQAAHRMGTRSLKHPALWAIAVASFVGMALLSLPFPAIIIAAASCGWLISRLRPEVFSAAQGHGTNKASQRPSLIDDDTPRPAHTHFSIRRLTLVILTGSVLWALPMGTLVLVWGWDHTLAQMGWFFTKAALLTFGGAYAVLPYVYQGAVEQFAWVTAPQMIDGLALGETTPGPLIMIVAFVGYVGGHTSALLGTDHAFTAGALAACVATWFTFLPSFLFILAGGPLVESTHGKLQLTGPLTAITAAVVGVVMNLTLFLSYHVFWPQGYSAQTLLGGLDGISVAIAAGAALALLRYQRSVVQVIGACALLGWLLKTTTGLS
jgi:chromate transporter